MSQSPKIYRNPDYKCACEETGDVCKCPVNTSRITTQKPSAADFLKAGINHMQDRASTYDKPQGERSMGKTITAFNAITGHHITEEQGWLFMGLLKMVRSQQGEFKADNYEDEASYAGLRGECAAKNRG